MATKRIVLFDEIRGTMIWCVVLYHLLYDLVYLFAVDIPWFGSAWTEWWQETVACLFIFISGCCCYFSRNNVLRGLRLLIVAALLSAATYLVMPQQMISFGIIHLLSLSVLIFALGRPLLSFIPPPFIMLGGLLLYYVTFPVCNGYLQFGTWNYSLPETWYQNSCWFWLGFPTANYYSADYFPLLPYLWIFLSGCGLGTYRSKDDYPFWAYQTHSKFLAFCGRNSLWLYLVHQPLLLAILSLIWQLPYC